MASTARGLEHVAGSGSFVYTPNHQSHLDILSLLGYLPGQTRFAAKKELWRHTIVGGVLDTLGMVPIDRERPEDSVERLKRAATARTSFVVFPEGTRSQTGALLPSKKGAFVLAIGAQLPVVPVICRGTRRLVPRGSGDALRADVPSPAVARAVDRELRTAARFIARIGPAGSYGPKDRWIRRADAALARVVRLGPKTGPCAATVAQIMTPLHAAVSALRAAGN